MDGDPEQSTCFHELFMFAEQKVVETQDMASQLLGDKPLSGESEELSGDLRVAISAHFFSPSTNIMNDFDRAVDFLSSLNLASGLLVPVWEDFVS